ncbi:hypothetical protein LIER_00765 [Lithospermum erythrorhizon]|uniref:Retrotransposon gag domain-containing protein n=1 Tax=Lithospermum erythrorhizon TaxID=34254 RepID=A0AAV3NM72_LITER
MPGHNTLFRKHVSHIFVMLRNTKEQRLMVWRHFCLCYEGQKLINHKACIGSYGIKDGDQNLLTSAGSRNKPFSENRDSRDRPNAHCQNVRDLVKFVSKHNEVLCQAFPTTLEGKGRTWYEKLPVVSIHNFQQQAKLFVQAFQHERPTDRNFRHLMRIRQMDDETLREFVGRFNGENTTVGHVADQALVTSFVEGLKWDKFSEALATKYLTKRTFSEILTLGQCNVSTKPVEIKKSNVGDPTREPLGTDYKYSIKVEKEDPKFIG